MDGAEYSGEEDTTNVIGGADNGKAEPADTQKPDQQMTGRCSRDSELENLQRICRAKSRFGSENINFSWKKASTLRSWVLPFGKTTLMNIVGCLDQATASGRLILDGQDINKCSDNQMSDIRLQKSALSSRTLTP